MATSSKPSSPTPPPRSPSPTSHSDDHEDEIPEEPQTDEDIQTCLRDAEALKVEGNDHFRASRWNEALASYRSALGRLPRRKFVERKTKEGARGRKKWDIKGKGREDGDEDEEKAKESVDAAVSSSSVQAEPGEASGAAEEKEDKAEEKEEPVKLSPLEMECAKARSVLNANIGACHIKLKENAAAVEACTEALLDDPSYIKALQRRAQCNEALNTWSSLTKAQEDYTTLLDLLPDSSPQLRDVNRALTRLGPRIEVAQKQELEEMMGKLKGFGNSLLGKFGLSTDNFKFEPNGQGGYSMNFAR
ncbi:TPR-like protein [Stereum hirsutum FP-91666 SS1]|uniref:TPR-like protein n=1 Tax=Stereum hirsutum (strain FP-91666) TaxID=721885 RepID=UPI000444A66B|nr:TPR-like protein [Stereum hirsutum FP-91666 SS1]EIM83355.1 TPR-like protein [Stereum hirsutum FP-91666 SS1]